MVDFQKSKNYVFLEKLVFFIFKENSFCLPVFKKCGSTTLEKGCSIRLVYGLKTQIRDDTDLDRTY